MKAIFTLLAVVAVSLVGCKDDKGGLLDPNAKVYINGATAPAAAPEASKAGQTRLTPKEVVEKAQRFVTNKWEMDVADWNRDVANTRIVVVSSWVVRSNGELDEDFIASRNNILVTVKEEDNRTKDTIAYIPNAIMDRVEKEVRAAYATKDYAACYRLFQEGYQFTPITGAEFKALKEQGQN